MTRYIGLDVHAQTTAVGVLSDTGKRLTHRIVQTRANELIALLHELPKPRRLILEEGAQSAWLSEVLEPHVNELVVTVPRPVKHRAKNDIEDAFARAEDLRRNAIDKRIFKARPTAGALKAASKLYEVMTRDLVRAKNRFRGLLLSRGIVSKVSYDPTVEELTTLHAQLPAHLRFTTEAMLEQVGYLSDLQSRASDVLIEEARKHPAFRHLVTIPGIGQIRAATVLAVVIDPHRFRQPEQFRSYCGLGVLTVASGEWVKDEFGRVSRARTPMVRGLKNGNALLKSVFCGAALTVASLTGPLADHYATLLKRNLKPELARLTLARKLAAITLAVWKSQEDYDPKKHTTVK